MSMRHRRFYGYRYGRGVSLARAVTAIEKRLGVSLESRYSGHTGEYFCLWNDDKEQELVVHMNEDKGVPYIWWCADFSPIIEVASRSKATYLTYERKLLAIPGIDLSWKFGDRKRRFVGTKEGRDVSFIIEVDDGSRTIAKIEASGVSFATLMRVVKLERGRELWGIQELSREQVDRLKVTLPRSCPVDAVRFVLNLNSIEPTGSGEYQALARPRR